MAAKEIRTFEQILDAITWRAKTDTSTAQRDRLREMVNTVYKKIVFEEPYRWTGENGMLMLKAKYATGTLTATNGSDVVTGAGTTWVENDHRFSHMQISGSNHTYRILRVASATEITLDAPWTGTTSASLTYTIFKDEYGLFPDLMDIRHIRLPGMMSSNQPLPCGPTEMDEIRARSPFTGGWPKRYTLWGNANYTAKTWATFNLNTDYWEDTLDTEPRNKNLIFWPGIFSEDKPAIVRYTKMISPLAEETDEPVIPDENREVLVWGVLSEHFLVNRDVQTRNYWEGMYRDEKQKMASDIETTSDELVLQLDRSRFSRQPKVASIYDEQAFLST